MPLLLNSPRPSHCHVCLSVHGHLQIHTINPSPQGYTVNELKKRSEQFPVQQQYEQSRSSRTSFWFRISTEREGEAIPPVPDIYDRSQEHKLLNKSTVTARRIRTRKRGRHFKQEKQRSISAWNKYVLNKDNISTDFLSFGR